MCYNTIQVVVVNLINKKIRKSFNFSKNYERDNLPRYVLDYVFDGEKILAAYKTDRDHGVFTDKKIVLFDTYSRFGIRKQIYTIPYRKVSTISVTFEGNKASFDLLLDCGYPVTMKFTNMEAKDKIRLRILYSCVSRAVNDQSPLEEDIKKLVEESARFKLT